MSLQATHHKGLLYFTTSEFWGSGAIRMPSVYYGIVQPGAGLCAVSRLEWGVVASQDGLALAYPVIAARKETSATLAFAYSGAGSISDGVYPANPGRPQMPPNAPQCTNVFCLSSYGLPCRIDNLNNAAFSAESDPCCSCIDTLGHIQASNRLLQTTTTAH